MFKKRDSAAVYACLKFTLFCSFHVDGALPDHCGAGGVGPVGRDLDSTDDHESAEVGDGGDGDPGPECRPRHRVRRREHPVPPVPEPMQNRRRAGTRQGR